MEKIKEEKEKNEKKDSGWLCGCVGGCVVVLCGCVVVCLSVCVFVCLCGCVFVWLSFVWLSFVWLSFVWLSLVVGFGLLCEPPAGLGPPGFTRQPENSKRAHLSAPALQTPPKFHEKTPEREDENEFCGGTETKGRNFGPPTFGA